MESGWGSEHEVSWEKERGEGEKERVRERE